MVMEWRSWRRFSVALSIAIVLLRIHGERAARRSAGLREEHGVSRKAGSGIPFRQDSTRLRAR